MRLPELADLPATRPHHSALRLNVECTNVDGSKCSSERQSGSLSGAPTSTMSLSVSPSSRLLNLRQVKVQLRVAARLPATHPTTILRRPVHRGHNHQQSPTSSGQLSTSQSAAPSDSKPPSNLPSSTISASALLRSQASTWAIQLSTGHSATPSGSRFPSNSQFSIFISIQIISTNVEFTTSENCMLQVALGLLAMRQLVPFLHRHLRRGHKHQHQVHNRQHFLKHNPKKTVGLPATLQRRCHFNHFFVGISIQVTITNVFTTTGQNVVPSGNRYSSDDLSLKITLFSSP